MRSLILILTLLMGAQAQAWFGWSKSWRNPNSPWCKANIEAVEAALLPEDPNRVSFIQIRYEDERRNRNVHERWFTAYDMQYRDSRDLRQRCWDYRLDAPGYPEMQGLKYGGKVCGIKVMACNWRERRDDSDDDSKDRFNHNPDRPRGADPRREDVDPPTDPDTGSDTPSDPDDDGIGEEPTPPGDNGGGGGVVNPD